MTIAEAQLDTWSHQGSVKQSSSTYGTIKMALEIVSAPYFLKKFNVFLQGSYGNDTNIYSESDVDIVIVLNDCWHSDLVLLPPADVASYRSSHIDSTYTLADFRREVVGVLRSAYGSDVKVGDKAIGIAAAGSRRKADVIPALQYRRYYKFKDSDDQSFESGVCFYNSNGILIANYPKQHLLNCTRKHQATSGKFKPMVRIFKNLRSHLISASLLDSGLAPSYYIEGMLYNVPDDQFAGSLQSVFYNILVWLRQTETNKLVTANGQYYLIRENSHVAWPRANYDKFMAAVVEYWNA